MPASPASGRSLARVAGGFFAWWCWAARGAERTAPLTCLLMSRSEFAIFPRVRCETLLSCLAFRLLVPEVVPSLRGGVRADPEGEKLAPVAARGDRRGQAVRREELVVRADVVGFAVG